VCATAFTTGRSPGLLEAHLAQGAVRLDCLDMDVALDSIYEDVEEL
jgi:hypothetical protein